MPHYAERIERKFNSMLDKYGKYVIYIRADRRIECSCWNPQTNEANSRCEDCLGLGYKITIERPLALIQVAMPMTQQEYAAAQTPIGIIPTTGNAIFLKRHIWPRVGDRIFEVEWDVERDDVMNRGRVARLVDAFSIQVIDRFHGKKGEIIGHKCAVHSEEVQYKWLEEQLKASNFTWSPTNIDGTLYDVSSA